MLIVEVSHEIETSVRDSKAFLEVSHNIPTEDSVHVNMKHALRRDRHITKKDDIR